MKNLDNYIMEKLHINKNVKQEYVYCPKTREELINCIKEKIEKEGLGTKENPLNLNDIDTSKVTDMSYLFDSLDGELRDLSKNGHFDISDWDVYNVEHMEYMFYGSKFDGDISNWDVSNVEDMYFMFYKSNFNGNISDWNVRGFKDMNYIFAKCPLEKNPPKWYKR